MSLSVEALKQEIEKGEIDTVVCGSVDMQGRLIGKRLVAKDILKSLDKGTLKMGMCRYFLAMNIEGAPGDGYKVVNWDSGFGNCTVRADFATLRRTPWMEGSAIVMCDPYDDATHEPLFCSPRVILKKQVERLDKMGLRMLVATELEFFLFKETYESAHKKQWRQLDTSQPHHRALHLLAGSVDEPFMRQVRKAFEAAEIPLEATHPEYGPGQNELNYVPGEPVEMADRHILSKMAIHEMAQQNGLAATFMAKQSKDDVGSSCHIHVSLDHKDTGKPAFYDESAEYSLSDTGRAFIAGLVKYAKEYTYFHAPYINSYKRLQPNSWAPTKICWVLDNRTGAYRLCSEGKPNIHVECRIGGADLNPYLAIATLIAAGLAGIEEGLQLPPPYTKNAYADKDLPDLPHTLPEATKLMADSDMLKKALGEDVVRHYVNAARIEQEEFDKQVTDWELMRCFDRC